MLEVFKTFRGVQVDPIDVVARSHELVLFNRVNNFHKNDLLKSLYEDRHLYEYWLQLFSIIPIEFYPQLSARRKVVDQWHTDFQTANQQSLNQAKQYIYENGPTSSKELSHIKSTRSYFSWNNVQTASAILDFLWDRGELVIHHRENNRKYYDFPFRTLGMTVIDVADADSRDWILESFFKYTGIVRANIFNRVGYSRELQLRLLFLQKLDTGEITQLEIPGTITRYFALTSELPLIEKLGSQDISQQINFLPPLDPLILDRQMVKDFFNFDYTWEAYTPLSKRKFGYYGMPVLYKGNFIGQLDLKKEPNNLKVKNSTLMYPTVNSKEEIKAEFRRFEEFCLEKN